MKQFKLTTPCIAAFLTLYLWAGTNLAGELPLPPIAFKADATHCATNGTLVMQGHCALTLYTFHKYVIHADQINMGGVDHGQFLYATGNVRVVVNVWRGEGKFIGIATCSEAEMTYSNEITLRGTPVCLTSERGDRLEAPVIHLEELTSGMRITFETNVTLDVSRTQDMPKQKTTRTSWNSTVPVEILDVGTNCARVAADRFVYDHTNDTAWFDGNCVLMLLDYTLYAGTMRIMGSSQYIESERDLDVYASNGVRICIAPQSATGVVTMAVGAEVTIGKNGIIKLTGSPSPVLRRGGTYLRAKRITYTLRTGVWKFDPAPEASTEPPQDMHELFTMPTNATTSRSRTLRR